MKNKYFIPSINIGKFADSHRYFYTNFFDFDLKKEDQIPISIRSTIPTHILGYGFGIGSRSKIGPIHLLVHSNSFTRAWHVFFSFGFRMP